MQQLLARRVEEHHVLREVVGSRGVQEAHRSFGVFAQRERIEPTLLQRAAERFPFVDPRLQPVHAAQDEIELLGSDAVRGELQFRPSGHLSSQAELQAHAHEARAQQLAAEHVRHEEFESTTLDLHEAPRWTIWPATCRMAPEGRKYPGVRAAG